MAQSRVPLRQQIVGLVAGWTELGESGEKQHIAKIIGLGWQKRDWIHASSFLIA